MVCTEYTDNKIHNSYGKVEGKCLNEQNKLKQAHHTVFI